MKKLALLSLSMAAPAFAAVTGLDADADTHIRFGTNQANNYGTTTELDTRQNDTAPRDYMAYVRFNLSTIPGPISDATFSLTQAGGDTLVGARVRVLGLNNVAGNTAQDWDETALTFDNAGSEIDTSIYPGPPAAGQTALDIGVAVTDFEAGITGITESATGGVLSLSGPTLASWLEGRRNDGGFATFIIDFPANGSVTDKQVRYASKENLSIAGPSLNLTHIPEPSVALLGGLSLLGFLRRRR